MEKNTPNQADEFWIAKSKANPLYFGVLYNRYFKFIFRFIYNRTRDKDLTADLTQQTFLKALLHLPQFIVHNGRFKPWLFQIAINEINQHYRKQKQSFQFQIKSSHIQEMLIEIEEPFLKKEEWKLLFEALEKLENDKRSLVEFRFFDELSYKEIGELLSISEDNARKTMQQVESELKLELSVSLYR